MLSRMLRCRALLFASFALQAASLQAQSPAEDWPGKLIHHPLYLRESWVEDKLSFDGAGKPATPAHHGPLTLSGVDIASVKVSGKTMQLRGQRVVLISAGQEEPLQRITAINSVTNMLFTVQKRYIANEPVDFTVHADETGSFTAPLAAVFADGLAQLAPSVPAYWRCYAASYFVEGTVSASAQHEVRLCAESQSPIAVPGDQVTPVQVVQRVQPHFTNAALQLHIHGTSTVYANVNSNGVPSEFQVISAVGAGLDEGVLQAVSQFTFKPAMLDGTPVRSSFEFHMGFESK